MNKLFYFVQMVYGRRKSKNYGKSSGGKRTLSTRNIFNNKGARSQAAQIAALKKRISAVSKICSPEVKVVESNINQYSFNSIPLPNSSSEYKQAHIHALKVPSQATTLSTDAVRIGDKVRALPTQLFMSFQYEEIYNSMNSGLSNIKFELPTSAIQSRIVVLQQKVADAPAPTYNDIFEHQNVYEDDAPANPLSALMMMKSPFKTGITTRYHILMDRQITVSRDFAQKAVRFSVKPKIKSLRWYNDEQTGSSASPSGQLWLFILTSGWSNKQWNVEGATPIYDYNNLNVMYRTRTPFTDA